MKTSMTGSKKTNEATDNRQQGTDNKARCNNLDLSQERYEDEEGGGAVVFGVNACIAGGGGNLPIGRGDAGNPGAMGGCDICR